MENILIQGGPLLWLILIGGLVAVAIFFERWFHIHRAKIKTDDFLNGIFNILSRHNIAEALTICKETPGPVAYLARTAVMHFNQQPALIERALDEAALTEIARLERHFNTLATIAHIAPLLGLLGTVAGMMQAFIAIQQQSPLVSAADLAGGIWMALTTTVAGLIVAIFSYFGYNLLVSKTAAIVLDMERTANEITGFLIG
ncbi:MAG: MotA/TolQ/ExbB proton channel family protein, partial [Kiritimatiellia bacterium]|nr:MotA/TolQ/ExbB proton channel family protein [Kiritimatiellia bacterium]